MKTQARLLKNYKTGSGEEIHAGAVVSVDHAQLADLVAGGIIDACPVGVQREIDNGAEVIELS